MRTPVPKPKPEYFTFLKPYGPAITDLALAVRELVMSEAHGAVELIYDAYNAVATGYSFTGRPSDGCIHIAVYAKWVNLGFHRGSAVAGPGGPAAGKRQVGTAHPDREEGRSGGPGRSRLCKSGHRAGDLPRARSQTAGGKRRACHLSDQAASRLIPVVTVSY
jgi:hypothetical protein